jgi:hypothetical protein
LIKRTGSPILNIINTNPFTRRDSHGKKVLNLKHAVKGKVVSVGIDVDSLSWQIAALTDGEVIMAVTISKPGLPKFKTLFAPHKLIKLLQELFIKGYSKPYEHWQCPV